MNSQNEILKDYRARRKQRIIYVMGGKCACCGYQRSSRALELHHLNPEEKEFSLSQWVVNWADTINELQKCILVCANCHREIHDNLIDNNQLSSSYDKEKALEITLLVEESRNGKKYYCDICGAEITAKATYCVNCANERQRLVPRPSREQLKEDIRLLPMVQVGKKYGVSDNAIRKWCRGMGLPSKSTEIKKYTNEEWYSL